MTTYALIGAIESEFNDTNVNTGLCESCKRRLESEAIECFTAWRKNAGELKDIPIYAVCPTKNVISDITKEKFKELNVTYIEDYQKISETFTSGFLCIPLIGAMMEEQLTEDVLIKIDLDMNIIKPLPNKWLTSDPIIIGQYDDYCTKHQREGIAEENPFDTGFIISKRDSGFYKHFFDMCMKYMLSDDPDWLRVKAQTGDYYLEEWVVDRMYAMNSFIISKRDSGFYKHFFDMCMKYMLSDDPDWLRVKAQTGDYYLEEWVVDRMYAMKSFDIKPVQKYQIGEWYTPVQELSDTELDDVYFWHEHLEYDPEYNRMQEKIDFARRLNGK